LFLEEREYLDGILKDKARQVVEEKKWQRESRKIYGLF
jgi:hypothetical protein